MKGAETFIVKIQLSLNSTERARQILIYNEDRSIQSVFPASGMPDVVTALRGESKAYFEAFVTESGKLELLRRMPEQAW